MRVVICVRHNELMELNRRGVYHECLSCKEAGRRGDPHWFPSELARVNHKDGSMKRTWVAVFNRWTTSKWKWERER